MNAQALVASESSEEAIIPNVHQYAKKAVFGGNSRLQGCGIMLDKYCGL